jgi:hypothetical protein
MATGVNETMLMPSLKVSANWEPTLQRHYSRFSNSLPAVDSRATQGHIQEAALSLK